MTLSDSHVMNLPAPMDAKSDRIRISKKRLIAVLSGLGLLTAANDGSHVVKIIELLWNEASEYDGTSEESVDIVENGTDTDEVELGVLKWTLYGAEANQPSWFSKFCMPCGEKQEVVEETRVHPVQSLANVRRTGGELVRHDVSTCPLCRDATGCPLAEALDEPTEKASDENSPSSLQEKYSVEIALEPRVKRDLSSQDMSLPFDENDEEEEESAHGIVRQSVIKPLLSEGQL